MGILLLLNILLGQKEKSSKGPASLLGNLVLYSLPWEHSSVDSRACSALSGGSWIMTAGSGLQTQSLGNAFELAGEN